MALTFAALCWGAAAAMLAPLEAAADRRALTVDVAGAWTAAGVSALVTEKPKETVVFAPSVLLGARYALTNSLELSLAVGFDVPVGVWHNRVSVLASGRSYPGSLAHQTSRWQALAGMRGVVGLVWRFHAGLELGWSRRSYWQLAMYDDLHGAAYDYRLELKDASVDQLVVAPLAGVEWAGGDHWSLALLPRLQLLAGRVVGWELVVPLQLSWSWYL